jgi:hypothetical protein
MLACTREGGDRLTRNSSPAAGAERNGEGGAPRVEATASGAAGVVNGGGDPRARQKQPRAVNHAVARRVGVGAGHARVVG